MVDRLGDYQQTAGLDVGPFGPAQGPRPRWWRRRNGRLAWRRSCLVALDDLAGEYLASVHQPTLLIVGARDPAVLQLHQEAMTQLAGETRLEIVPGESRSFPEPGALEQVARHATAWFVRHLQFRAPRPPR